MNFIVFILFESLLPSALSSYYQESQNQELSTKEQLRFQTCLMRTTWKILM